jgi:hypothetical protein
VIEAYREETGVELPEADVRAEVREQAWPGDHVNSSATVCRGQSTKGEGPASQLQLMQTASIHQLGGHLTAMVSVMYCEVFDATSHRTLPWF